MKFSTSLLYVKNVVKSLDFYTQAFDLKVKFLHDTKSYGEIATGSTRLCFAHHSLIESNFADTKIKGLTLSNIANKPLSIEIGLEIDENKVIHYYEKAQKFGATSIAKPNLKPWGQLVAYLQDLDGYLISLGSNDYQT
ncbi:MAG: VOC family protein [SAR324 cluster bacterium]|nr:VOC family protein [SAR324 cluster bacterium]